MQCILVDSPTLGFERILKQITHMGIHCIYQNLDNIYCITPPPPKAKKINERPGA